MHHYLIVFYNGEGTRCTRTVEAEDADAAKRAVTDDADETITVLSVEREDADDAETSVA